MVNYSIGTRYRKAAKKGRSKGCSDKARRVLLLYVYEVNSMYILAKAPSPFLYKLNKGNK